MIMNYIYVIGVCMSSGDLCQAPEVMLGLR
jgi:hypothetical protein